MTKETYTPGPHHVNVAFSGNYVMADDKTTAICLCHRLEDAALHAAAADLLVAAKEAEKYLPTESIFTQKVARMLRAAIAKAMLDGKPL